MVRRMKAVMFCADPQLSDKWKKFWRNMYIKMLLAFLRDDGTWPLKYIIPFTTSLGEFSNNSTPPVSPSRTSSFISPIMSGISPSETSFSISSTRSNMCCLRVSTFSLPSNRYHSPTIELRPHT